MLELEQELKETGNTIPVFVYGSLLSGLLNHSILSTSTFGGVFSTSDRGLMKTLGAFPGVILDAFMPIPQFHKYNNTDYFATIIGELWWVSADTLALLDRLEGHPDFYIRSICKIIPWRNDNRRAEDSDEIISFNSFGGKNKPAPGYGSVWIYTLPASYFVDTDNLITKLSGFNVRGCISWRHAVNGTYPENSCTIR